jgi:hypothetical protein
MGPDSSFLDSIFFIYIRSHFVRNIVEFPLKIACFVRSITCAVLNIVHIVLNIALV